MQTVDQRVKCRLQTADYSIYRGFSIIECQTGKQGIQATRSGSLHTDRIENMFRVSI